MVYLQYVQRTTSRAQSSTSVCSLSSPLQKLACGAESTRIPVTPCDKSAPVMLLMNLGQLMLRGSFFSLMCSSEVLVLKYQCRSLFCFPSNGVIPRVAGSGCCVASILPCKWTGMIDIENIFRTIQATLKDSRILDQFSKVKRARVSSISQSMVVPKHRKVLNTDIWIVRIEICVNIMHSRL